MFDGIDEVVLLTADSGRARRLYVDHLGFAPADDVEVADPQVLQLWGLPPEVATVTRLRKEGSSGGGIRLVDAPGLDATAGRRSMQHPGPFAIDFYIRDLDGLHARLLADGFAFRSPPQHYDLFGTGFSVDEVILEGPEAILHALVGYLPRQHRCVLGERPDQQVSEVVAMVTLVDDLPAGRWLLNEVLGAETYFDQEFSGPAIERLLDLPPATSFRAVIVRGPQRRNARAELMTCVADQAHAPAAAQAVPRLFPSIVVPDLEAVTRRLAAGTHGVSAAAPIALPPALGGGRATSITTPFGFFCELREQQ